MVSEVMMVAIAAGVGIVDEMRRAAEELEREAEAGLRYSGGVTLQ
jgi:hypothetical protein